MFCPVSTILNAPSATPWAVRSLSLCKAELQNNHVKCNKLKQTHDVSCLTEDLLHLWMFPLSSSLQGRHTKLLIGSW